MSELRSVVEREMARAGAPSFGMPQIDARRANRQRAKRVRATVVAGIVALALGAALAALLRQAPHEQPADHRITSGNVSQLHVVFTAAEGTQVSTPTVADGLLFIASGDGTLSAYHADCPSGGACLAWSAEVGGSLTTQPVVADGMVFTTDIAQLPDDPRGRIYAFDQACGDQGATCVPAWTAPAQAGFPSATPVIAGDRVYVMDPAAEELRAYPVHCSDPCRPVGRTFISGPVFGRVFSLATNGEEVFAGTANQENNNSQVLAIDVPCDGRCRIAWHRKMLGGVYGLTAVEDHLYVGTTGGYTGKSPGLEVYSVIECRRTGGACEPEWTADRSGDVVRVTEAGGDVYVSDFSTLSAYPVDCRADGRTCRPLWHDTSDQPFTQGLVPVVSGDLVFTAGRMDHVLAFPRDCADPCAPVWSGTGSMMGALGGVAVWNGHVAAGGSDGLTVFGVQPSEDPLAAPSTSDARPEVPWAVIALVVVGGLVFVLARWRHRTGGW